MVNKMSSLQRLKNWENRIKKIKCGYINCPFWSFGCKENPKEECLLDKLELT